MARHLVQEAMAEELSYFNDIVWEATGHTKAKAADEFMLVRTRWVLCSTGGIEAPDVRARLVACEVNTSKSTEFLASTPPLEAKQLLFSDFASRRCAANGGV